ncbi:hypothetical protein DJ021_00915 [Phenylobacterium hankyongense]|uniref:Uncharacterized protein n=1 Tax=Phenylobacterium hankyongense TaxID=1813876 RepID=A0A328AV10_9CAUL|nr:hypothetical protein [Phenylobacterium hankyongense]RAK58457.1 hypothetical protein DJ021_00915 [Phenylobacterium hankyongense]
MNKVEDQSNVIALAAAPGPAGRLPYAIELWNLPRTARERVIGRAASIVLARAIFAAAQSEHLGRRIILRRGTEILEQSD